MAELRVVALGDSLMWGQGLPRSLTFAARLCTALSGLPHATAAGPKGLAMRAHSGAVIGLSGRRRLPTDLPRRLVFGVRPVPDWLMRGAGTLGGEVASTTPTVAEQVQAYVERPEAVHLVLLNGGGNDIGASWYLNPATSLVSLDAAIARYCGRDMATLIHLTAERFPNAVIVVPGYMQSLSASSEKGVLAAFFPRLLLAPLIWRSRTLIDRVLERSAHFRRRTAEQLRATVATVSAELMRREHSRAARLPGGRVLFADVEGFSAKNAANGENAWVWGLDVDSLRPQDPLRDFRQGACRRFGRWSTHYFASVGHPNERGAEEIFRGILRALLDWAGRTPGGGARSDWIDELRAAIFAAAHAQSIVASPGRKSSGATVDPAETR